MAMKSAGEVVEKAAQALTIGQTSNHAAHSIVLTTDLAHLSDTDIDQFFARMAGNFTWRWTSALPTTKAVKVAMAEWAEGLAGLSADQIRNGFTAVKAKFDWPPSIREFKHAALDLPSKETAIARAMRNEPSDSVSYRLVYLLGSWNLANLPARELNRLASAFYEEAVSAAIKQELQPLPPHPEISGRSEITRRLVDRMQAKPNFHGW